MAIPGLTGIGSGMDIKGMVDALVNAERAPKAAQLSRLEKTTTAKFSALSQFKNSLAEFQDSLKKLNDPALFEKRSASSGKTDVFTVTANAKAAPGNYNVQIFNLAQTSKVALAGVDDPAAAVGTGKLSIKAGETALDIDVTEANNSLTGIRDAINAAGKSKGLSATIVSDPSGAGGARLVLSSDKSGANNDIAVSVTPGDTGNLSVLAFTPPAPDADYTPMPVDENAPREARVISYARDANLAIDGIRISSSTNTVDDAIEGVTLNLRTAQSKDDQDNAAVINLNVAEDKAGVKKSINDFVAAYNKMLDTVESLTSVIPVGGDDGQPLAAALVGDASVRSFMSAMRSELGSAGGETGGIRILADLGVTTQRDGKLAVDSDKLDKAVNENFDQLNGFLTGNDGLMARLGTKISPFTDNGGILDSRTKALQNTLSSVDDQRRSLDLRIEKVEARLLKQFNTMDSLLGQLAGTSNYLTGVLDSLPGVVKQSK